ncbi:hypothetical protein BDV06DRAFT_202107 [Aspergillus oleicola]
MVLQFIDHGPSGIGGSDRRIIRSHVMQGKNKGKPRRSTKKQIRAPVPYVLPRQVFWGDLCLTSFPQQLDSKSTALMHRWFFDVSDALFPPQFCTKFDIIKSIWVNCILADEAYFHSTLAISASYVDFVQRKPAISRKTLHHISQAYALVNVKLSGPLSVSDSAIAAVVSLAIYQQVHRQAETGLIHLHGLYRMIQLRGGIAQLMQENRALALKPLRLDVELALQNGRSLIFGGSKVPVYPVLCHSSIKNRHFFRLPPCTPQIMVDLLSFSTLLNEVERGRMAKLDALDYTETLLALLYCIVEASPTRQTHASNSLLSGVLSHDLVHLAMLVFMTTLLPEYTRDGSSCTSLSESLKAGIENLAVPTESPDSHALLVLWILFISGIAVLKPRDCACLLPLIGSTCKILNLSTWAAIQCELSQFPWIFALHDAPGRWLWEEVHFLEHCALV